MYGMFDLAASALASNGRADILEGQILLLLLYVAYDFQRSLSDVYRSV